VIPAVGVIFSLFLMAQVNWQRILTSAILFAIGVPIYVFFSPRKEQDELKKMFLSRDAVLEGAYHQGEVFLANVVRHVKWQYYSAKKVQRAWSVEDSD
jgi:hypothetical protein